MVRLRLGRWNWLSWCYKQQVTELWTEEQYLPPHLGPCPFYRLLVASLFPEPPSFPLLSATPSDVLYSPVPFRCPFSEGRKKFAELPHWSRVTRVIRHQPAWLSFPSSPQAFKWLCYFCFLSLSGFGSCSHSSHSEAESLGSYSWGCWVVSFPFLFFLLCPSFLCSSQAPGNRGPQKLN